MSFHVPEPLRLTRGTLRTDASYGNNGVFLFRVNGHDLRVIASDGAGWNHISVSLAHRCPTWGEMCLAKSLFWDGEDCAIQYHPPQSEYVDCHPHCLHVWQPQGIPFPRPDPALVGGLPRNLVIVP